MNRQLGIKLAYVELMPLGFDLHKILVVDLMHKVELGVWKAVFVMEWH